MTTLRAILAAIAGIFLLGTGPGLAVAAEATAPAQTFVQSDKCPFTLGVLDSMQVDPFGGKGDSGFRYHAVETEDAVRASFSQQSASGRASYFVRCTGNDPAKWLSRFGVDQDTACKRIDRYKTDEMRANAFCALTAKDTLKTLLTGTWSKDPGKPDTFRERARFTAAQPGVGSISVRLIVNSPDSGEARRLAEQLVATLALKSPPSQAQ